MTQPSKQRTIIVSGATGYFGRYIIEDLAQTYHVVALTRDPAKSATMFSNPNVTCVEYDLYDHEKSAARLKKVCQDFNVWGLVNNAYDFSEKTGFNTPSGRIENISIDAMRAGLESGVLGPMVAAQTVGLAMVEKKIPGSIINISSMYGSVAPDRRLYDGKKVLNPVTYGVAKTAINGLTRYLSSFWGEYGIRCNSVAPGTFPNVETNSFNAPKDDEFTVRLKNKTTLDRVGHPRDLLGMIRLLLSDESSYITGQILNVDGGWTAI